MMNYISNILNRFTMYRLMLYFLLLLWAGAIVFSLANILPYRPADIFFSGIFFMAACQLANQVFARLLRVKTNLESALITGLILTLIVGPGNFLQNIFTLSLIAVIAMASKYLLVVRKKHVFNPAAIAVLTSGLFLKSGASWWIGSIYTLPLIVLGGFMVLTRIKRFEQAAGFLSVYFLAMFLSGRALSLSVLTTPILWFFVCVMLIEPLTSPSIKKLQFSFGLFVGLVYILLPKIIPGYAFGFETALVAGNLFHLALMPSTNIVLEFIKKEVAARDTWSFYFKPATGFAFIPGQYLEWTCPHPHPDSRGVRRYFTVSSSPNDKYLALTMRVSDKSSSFKNALLDLSPDKKIFVSGPYGDFTLPHDPTLPLAFIAGGIGITPFASMIKYLLENDQKRDIVLFYSNKNREETAFEPLFKNAEKLGVKTVYINTSSDGYIDEKMIKDKLPDYHERIFYVSGPEPMVAAFKSMLANMGIKHIRTDFFPGYTQTHQK